MKLRHKPEQRVQLPSAEIYVTWDFSAPVEVMEWDVTVHRDPGDDVGQYLALYHGAIDGSACYLGLQTDMHHPRLRRGVGKGLIFSTWWTLDGVNCRCPVDGFVELGTHEGGFVGVRRKYPWTTGSYRVTLSRSETERVGENVMDWFTLSVNSLDDEPRDSKPDVVAQPHTIGAIRFPRLVLDRPARIAPGMTFLEVYSGVRTWSEVPPLAIDVMAFGDGARCPGGSTEYPRPYGVDVPIADVEYDQIHATVQLRLAGSQRRRHPPARWP